MKVTKVSKTAPAAADRQPRPAELIKKNRPKEPQQDSRFESLLKAELLKGGKK